MTKPTSTTVFLASRVRQVRLLRGLTQSDVAGRAGLSRATYQRFERVGVLGLDGFVRVLECLGLGSQVAALATDDAAAIAQAHASRQRGRRRVRSGATEPPPGAGDRGPAAGGIQPPSAPSAATVPRDSAAMGEPSPDAAAVAEAASKYHHLIGAMIRSIVWNRLTNFTAGQVVSNLLRGERNLAPAARPAIVAALEAELQQLNPDKVAEYHVGLPEFLAWQPTWKPGVPIVRALE